MKKLSLFIISFFLIGCAAVPPATYNFQSRKTYDAAYDKVLASITGFLNENIPSIPEKEESGIITVEDVKIPYKGFYYESDFCDCGKLKGLYVYHEILGTFNISLKKIEDKKTSVEVIANYRASMWSGKTFKGWVTCQSKGYFEQNLFKHLDSVLKVRKKT